MKPLSDISSSGETLHIEDVRFYNRVLTNRCVCVYMYIINAGHMEEEYFIIFYSLVKAILYD